MDNIHKLNQIILDSLPHWAMLIDVTNRTVLAANKLALEGGANINCQCWDDFGHRQFISDAHKKLIKIEPERKRDNQIKCDFCLADEAMEITEIRRTQKDLEEAQKEVKTLKRMLPICSQCKKIRDDSGYWNKLETYISTHSETEFSHGICPNCMEEIYRGEEWYETS